MRRNRAIVSFGTVLAVLAVATISVRSGAASAMREGRNASPQTPPPKSSPVADVTPLPLTLTVPGLAVTPPFLADSPLEPARLALLAGGDDSLLGSFLARRGRDPRPHPHAGGASAPQCAADQIEVDGDYCPSVEQQCLRWLDPETHLQCAEFARTPASSRCRTRTQHERFCIDRYEWPNKAGAMPVYMESWVDAKASCEADGKRLCTDEEWTLACEGPAHQPYPYGDGYTRDDAACNIDKPYRWPHPERLYDPKTRMDELGRLDQREPSGSRASCVSPYGVHDMTGNVDEWVVNVSQQGKPFVSGLKGGYWGPVRTRCRPMTTAHDRSFRYYEIGFRCCGDPHVAGAAVGPGPLAAIGGGGVTVAARSLSVR